LKTFVTEEDGKRVDLFPQAGTEIPSLFTVHTFYFTAGQLENSFVCSNFWYMFIQLIS